MVLLDVLLASMAIQLDRTWRDFLPGIFWTQTNGMVGW